MSVKSFIREHLFANPLGAELWLRANLMKTALQTGRFQLDPCAVVNDPARRRRLLVDLTVISNGGGADGVPRVARNLFIEWRKAPPDEYDVVPVAEDGRAFRLIDTNGVEDAVRDARPLSLTTPLEVDAGDRFFTPVQLGNGAFRMKRFIASLRTAGVPIIWTVHDLTPYLCRSMFPAFRVYHTQRLTAFIFRSSDCLMTISRAVADDLIAFAAEHGIDMSGKTVSFAHNGAVFVKNKFLGVERARGHFLMVGSLAAHKGYGQLIDAFERLWRDGVEASLTIIGRCYQQTANMIRDRILSHPEYGKRLIWLDDASDEDLKRAYATSSALVYASHAEGFGLPLIEAAQNELSIIAREHPLFREVCGDHAYYFDGTSAESLASAIKDWMKLDAEGRAPQSKDMPFLTWEQAAKRWLDVIIGGDWYWQNGQYRDERLLTKQEGPKMLQNRTEQNRTEQNRTEQNRTEQNRTEQNYRLIAFIALAAAVCAAREMRARRGRLR